MMNFKDSFSKINPTQSQKEKMLHKIQNKKFGGTSFNYRYVFLTLFILFFIVPISINEVVPIDSRIISEPLSNIYNCNEISSLELEESDYLYDKYYNGLNYEVYSYTLDSVVMHNRELNIYLECEEVK